MVVIRLQKAAENVGYQGRKASKTSNSLLLADNRDQMLAISESQDGQHHDLYDIKKLFSELCDLLKLAGIVTKGIFLNADPGFDSKDFRGVCRTEEIEANIKRNPRNKLENDVVYQYFYEELYKRRTVIEHANAWLTVTKLC